jgi:hypothetical protein
MAPQCEHCAYDLTGIKVHGFIAHCPECGQDSDVRRVPKPVIPWWHLPLALAAGAGVYAVLGFSALLVNRWLFLKGTRVPSAFSWVLMIVCAAVAATMTVVMLKADYLAKWRYRYGPGKAPREAWILLFEQWLIFAMVLGVVVPLLLTAFLSSLP